MATFDIYFQVVPAAQYTGMGFLSFGPPRSIGVSGIQKLLGIFTKYLLTPVGTDPLNLDAGTLLPGLIGSNVTTTDAQEIVQTAVSDTVAAIDAIQSMSDVPVPDDERIASASVTGFIIIDAGPGFAAQVFLQNVAGQGLQYLLPTLSTATP
jgi:hypothetical protein